MSKKETAEPLPYAEYQSVTDAPQDRRRLNDVPLSAEQMNWIARRAYELRTEFTAEDRISPEGVPVKGGIGYTENVKAAREEFKRLHEPLDGQWVRNVGEVN